MKHVFTLLFLTAIFTASNATVHTVTCQNSPSHFLPVTTNAVVGDTIEWEYVAGTHVVGPINTTYIPSGAAMFNKPIDAGNQGFQYKLTVAGNYHYVCHPATPHNEDGYIVVTGGTGVSSIDLYHVSSAYPNPFSDKLTIETTQGDMIAIYNMIGTKLLSASIKTGQTKTQVDVADLTSGIYFYSILKEGVIVETKKLVKE